MVNTPAKRAPAKRAPATKTPPNKAQAIMTELNKFLGKDVLQIASADKYRVDYWSTGLLPIDMLLHGGLPKGRFVEIYGAYSTLKSYIGLCTIAQVQAGGGVAAVIDTEHSFDSDWAKSIGVDNDSLIITRPSTGEMAIDAAETMIRSDVDFIMFDSIAAALPQDEQKKRLSDNNMSVARLAALMSAACRRLTAANSNTSILWINQTRTNVGMVFGNPETTPGGKAIPYYASYRLRMNMVESMKRNIEIHDGDAKRKTKETYAQKFKAEVVKSKLSSPFRDVFFNWSLETGSIDIPSFLMAQGVEIGVINVNNAMWRYKGKSVRGRDAFHAFLSSNPDACLELENRLRLESNLPEIQQSSVGISIPNAPKPALRLKKKE